MKFFKFLKRAKKRNPQAIGVYMSDDGRIGLIPVFHTKAGFGKQTDDYREIKPPYTLEEIGMEFISVWREAGKQPIIDEGVETATTPAWQLLSGKKRYSAFQKMWQMIDAEFDNENTIIFRYCDREEKGYCAMEGEMFKRKLPLHSTPVEIGRAVDEIYFEVNRRHIASL